MIGNAEAAWFVAKPRGSRAHSCLESFSHVRLCLPGLEGHLVPHCFAQTVVPSEESWRKSESKSPNHDQTQFHEKVVAG